MYHRRRECIVNTTNSPKQRKISLLSLDPQNQYVTDYCKSLVNIRIKGQKDPNELTKSWSSRLALSCEAEGLTLGAFLQSMDAFLRNYGLGELLTGEEEEFIYYMQGLLEMRGAVNVQRFVADVNKFVEIYNARVCISEKLQHNDYWGCRQQLLAGKVIADFVGAEYGPLDPVFGVLLSPVAGRVGPGDSGLVHSLFFDDDGPLAYHSAVHDAFGYLVTYHNLGPGYNYTGASAVLETSQCMSGQVSGLKFWRETLKNEKEHAIEKSF